MTTNKPESQVAFTGAMYYSIGQQYRKTCLAAAKSADDNRNTLTRSGQKSAARLYRNHAARCCRAMAYLRGRLVRQKGA